MIKDSLKKGIFKILPKKLKNYYEIKKWEFMGRPVSEDHKLKQKIVKEFGKKFRIEILIETGTYYGDMVYAQLMNFKNIISLELDGMLFRKAKKRFKKYKKIEIHHGDSGKILKEIVKKIEQNCLFWLDGHYSGGITAKSRLNTPIIQELKSISENNKKHVILIDDARCFNGKNDYPSIDFLKKFVKKNFKNYKFEVKEDIIRIFPK